MILIRKFNFINLPFKFNIYINDEFFGKVKIFQKKEIPLKPGMYNICLEIFGIYKYQTIQINEEDNIILEFKLSSILDICMFLPLINYIIIYFFVTKEANYFTTLGILIPGIIYTVVSSSKYAISTKVTLKKCTPRNK